MKHTILDFIKLSKKEGKKLLTLLLDPDKVLLTEVETIANKINNAAIDLIFVGGSTVAKNDTEKLIGALKRHIVKHIVIFPGDYSQITNTADGILFLSLLSGNNPEYLIHQQVKAIPSLQKTDLEIIPTGYILIDGNHKTAVQKVSNTFPISQSEISKISATALAGEYMGKQLIYLEAGSGAKKSVSSEIISETSKLINTPLIVGGGLRTKSAIQNAFDAGADIVVIGTAFEENSTFLDKI